jgi:hypothetical protein
MTTDEFMNDRSPVATCGSSFIVRIVTGRQRSLSPGLDALSAISVSYRLCQTIIRPCHQQLYATYERTAQVLAILEL